MTHQPTMALLSLPIAALVACGADDVATPDAAQSAIEVLVVSTPAGGAHTPVPDAEVVVTQADGHSTRSRTAPDGTARVMITAGDAVTVLYPDVANLTTVLDVQPGDALVFDDARPAATPAQSIEVRLPVVPGPMPMFDITTPCARHQTVAGETSTTLWVDAPCSAPMDISLEGFDFATGEDHGHALVTDATWTDGGVLDLSAVTLDQRTQDRSLAVAPVALPGEASIAFWGRYGRALYVLDWQAPALSNGLTVQVPLPGPVTFDVARVSTASVHSGQTLVVPLIDGRAELAPLASVTSVTFTGTQLTMELDGTETGDAVMAKLWHGAGDYTWTIVGPPDRRTLFVPPLRPFGFGAPTQGRVGLIDHPAVASWDQLRQAPALVDAFYDPLPPVGLRESDMSFF